MSKEVNINLRGYYQPGTSMYYSSNNYSDGSKSKSYTREDLPWSANPTTNDVDMRQLNYAAANYAPHTYDSSWSSKTKEINQASLNPYNIYSTSSSNIGCSTNLYREGQDHYGRSADIQGPDSSLNVVRSTYADRFVTHDTNNQDSRPILLQHTRETDIVPDSVNPMPLQTYNTQKSVPDSNISFEKPIWHNKEKNASIRVVPKAELKGRPQNPADPRFTLYPKELTFNVKIVGGVRIAQQVTKISYRKSLKNTAVYTIGRKGGSCKKALAEGKRKRALWWISQGKTTEEALILCLRPYHEIYEEILEKKHSWCSPMVVKNLLEQINKEGVYNLFTGQTQANESDTSDESSDEASEQPNQGCPPTYNNNMNVQQNKDVNCKSLIHESLPSQDNVQNMPTEKGLGKLSSQNASYDPTSHADHNRSMPVNSKPVLKKNPTKKNNPYVKVNVPKIKEISLQKEIKGAALRRYYYWLHAGKAPKVAKALCVLRMDQIPLYQQTKDTVGTLKHFVKSSRNQARFRGKMCIEAVAETNPDNMVDQVGYCDEIFDLTEDVCLQKPNKKAETFIPENMEGSAHELKNPKTSKTQLYSEEIEQFMKSLSYGGKKYEVVFDPVAIDRYRWWRHVGKTVSEARKMCRHPFRRYLKEYEEGVKIIDFKTYILEYANTVDKTAKCPATLKGHAKLRYNIWIKLGKTPKEAIDLTLQDSMPLRRQKQYMERLNKRNEKIKQNSQMKNNCDSSSVSIIPTIQIQKTIEEDFTKDTDNFDASQPVDNEINKHTDTKKTGNNTKKQEQVAQLTNAELTRFEWWRKQGLSEEEALDLCHKSMAVSNALNRIPSYKKEIHEREVSRSKIQNISQNSRGEIPNTHMSKKNATKTAIITEANLPQNLVSQDGPKLSITQNLEIHGNVKGEFRVCIKVNKESIDSENRAAFKNALNQCIADDDAIKIKSFNKRSNRIIITCLNEYTRDWLDKQIPTLVPWENAQLEIIDEDEVPIDILARFFIPYNTETECSALTPAQFMQQLQEQNPDVGCDRWVVHKVETRSNPVGVYIIACIDNKSKDVLISKSYKLKWFNKRNIKVKLSSTKKSRSKAESGARAVIFVPKVPECRLNASHQYILNRLHILNPTVGCDGWTIVQKKLKFDGATLLVRLNHTSKNVVENIKKLRWYRSQHIVITIVPIYVDINLPIDNESKHLRDIPQYQISQTLLNKLHFFNPSFGCLSWVIIKLQDNVYEWDLTIKINERCHQTLINRDYKLYWYGRWLEIKLGNVPELEMFKSKKQLKLINPVTSHEPKENVSEKNLEQVPPGSVLSPPLEVNEESKVQDASSRGIPPLLWNNPEKRPDISMLSSSLQDRSADMPYIERETHRYERHNSVSSGYNDIQQLSPAHEYAMPQTPEYARHPGGHGEGYLGFDNFEEHEKIAYRSPGILQTDGDNREAGLENGYRLELNRDPYSPNTEHRNVVNIDYINDTNQRYYNNENRHDVEDMRHSPYQNLDNIAYPDPQTRDGYMHQDTEGYNFDQHDRVDDREIDYVTEESNFDRGSSQSDREGNFKTEERIYDERYYGRDGMNFEGRQRYSTREKSPQDEPCLDLEYRSREETEHFQREWSPDHRIRDRYVDKSYRSHSRDNQRGLDSPRFRPEYREAVHDSRDSLRQNERARASEDRRHDALIGRLKRLAAYHDREPRSHSNRERQNSRTSFDEPLFKRRRRH